MGFRAWPRRRLAAVSLLVVLLLAGGAAAIATHTSGPAPYTERNVRIPVLDGPLNNQHVVLDATFFTPAGTGRVPAVLLAHGFGETKDAVRGQAIGLARAGFAVLTWSSRGFGRSTGQIALDSPRYEVKDVEQLVTWLARQPRVLLDHPGDPRVGIAGASYGGALALLAAGYDHRIDAVVPQITWNNLATALFPNAAGGPPLDGVFKRQWAGLLFVQGAVGFGPQGASRPGSAVSPAAACGRFLPSVCAMYQQVAVLGRATPQAIALLTASSPATVAGRIDAPTLLIQGENDSLFGLDQAAATFRQIRRNGTPVDLVWFDGGHDGGDQESARIDALAISWFRHWLAGSGWAGQPGFSVSRNLGFDPSTGAQSLGVATAPAFPGLAGSRRTLLRLGGPPQWVANPPGGSPPSMSSFPGLGALGGSSGLGLALDMPGQSAAFQSPPLAAPLQVTGASTVRIRVRGPVGLTLFAKVYDVDQAGHAILPFSLAAPLRLSQPSAGRVVTVVLPTMDYQFAAGHRIRLVFTTTDFGYATPAAPARYQVALASPGITLPTDPALVLQGRGLQWWIWVAPLVAVLLAASLLLTGRRRIGAPGQAVDPDVPLDIVGLTKRYRDGQLAVDGLDLRVERGQILGLLGPNGAGKTTTLRALMGLIRPDSGTITIFGRQVSAGSPALSRLGAFVEGPGFPPHLSGRDNLRLYWQAIGRPAADPHLDEVLGIAGLGSAIDRKVRSYSRGMCQRLAIAQAMLGLPDLLVLDEPLNGLDPPQIREMRDVLIEYAASGRTVILSSHMLAEVEQTCTHVVVMHLGRRIAAGPVEQISGDGGALLIGTPSPARAATVLSGLGGVVNVEVHAEGVLVHPGEVSASDLVVALVMAGIAVERVAPSRRLEDAFLALIGPVEQVGLAGTANGAAPDPAQTAKAVK
ncbi:MAG TPA: alpha/beta fold hydrolase [Streptosporangiaceae bacterium]|nr:alpha/beta fold hydrolase [Streptosporangiaceae bacterium]